MIEGVKVVTASEMVKIEQAALTEGNVEQTFMENAGAAVAEVVENFIEHNNLPKNILLFVGKGNNGGDAFAAGIKLLARGFKVKAFHFFPLHECSPLCKIMHEKFRSCGGIVDSILHFESSSIILDGLVGTGFKGKAEGILADAITSANTSGLPIIAIDIPSGLNATTGEVETVAICAQETVFLELAKIGFFLKEGWNHVGVLRHGSFGLKEKFIASANAVAYLPNDDQMSQLLPPIKRTRHKYERGYVIAIAGSLGMPGAALLCSYAALRSGAGIVRLFHPLGMEAELSGAPFEIIRQGWDQKNEELIETEAKRGNVMIIGPGIGRTPLAKRMVKHLLEKIALPMVIDADALFFLAENPSWKIPVNSVLTPHRGEMDRLLPHFEQSGKTYLECCQNYAEEKKVTIVLKGAITFIIHPNRIPIVITRGDPGMATAGSGDVLTGMIAALCAQGLDPVSGAALAVYLHGLSGEEAAASLTSSCVTASDLIDFLPSAFQSLPQ